MCFLLSSAACGERFPVVALYIHRIFPNRYLSPKAVAKSCYRRSAANATSSQHYKCDTTCSSLYVVSQYSVPISESSNRPHRGQWQQEFIFSALNDHHSSIYLLPKPSTAGKPSTADKPISISQSILQYFIIRKCGREGLPSIRTCLPVIQWYFTVQHGYHGSQREVGGDYRACKYSPNYFNPCKNFI